MGVGRAAAVWVNLTNEDAVRSGGKAAVHCALGVLRQREQPQWQQRQAPANQNSYELTLRGTTASHESHLAIYAGVCQRQGGGGDGAGQKRAAVLNHAAEKLSQRGAVKRQRLAQHFFRRAKQKRSKHRAIFLQFFRQKGTGHALMALKPSSHDSDGHGKPILKPCIDFDIIGNNTQN